MTRIGPQPRFAQNRATLMGFETAPTQLVHALISEKAPWLYSALFQIYACEKRGTAVQGVGDLRVRGEAADAVRTALLNVRLRSLPTPRVSAVSGGGMGVTWILGPRRIEFTSYPDGEVTYLVVDGNVILAADNVIDVDETGEQIVQNPTELTKHFQWLMGT